ncbi:hypothetical protein ACFOPQ_20220 [Deinococcus antarcticus]|uniref:LPP20 lipoprotein n=1 Tax=Deinococcus antarcticus TaxID=1298767 RepID=A0ABV8ACR8_9DEIO
MRFRSWRTPLFSLLFLGSSVFISEGRAVGNTKPAQTQIERIQKQQGQTPLWWPSDTPGPRQPLTPASQASLGQPTLDLTITLRLLRDQVKQGKIQLEPAARQTVRDLLSPLAQEPTLGSKKASELHTALLEHLRPVDVVLLEQQRATLERNVENILARTRLATPDGPVNRLDVRYGLMVPGGTKVVAQIRQQPTLNPYRQAGANTVILNELLTLLTR